VKPGLVIRSLLSVLALPTVVAGVLPAWLIFSRGAHLGFKLETPLNVVLAAVGLMLAAAGLALAAGTMRRFATQGEGTLAPWDPPRKLVVSGVYRHVRNPMISGVLGILAGEGLFFGSTAVLGWFAIFAAANAIYIPLFEEPGLAARFGRDYETYKRHVPRWIPRLTPWDPERA
jgi:protein-S-isoprenylcysteine O-methyltransferase Ste14